MASTLALIGTGLGGCAPRSILDVESDTVRVRLLDATSGLAIARADVGVHSNNGTRCVMAPCPTNGKQWRGISDHRGYVHIPSSVLQVDTHVETEGRHGDLIEGARRERRGAWMLELLPDSDDKAFDGRGRPIRLIDGRTKRPIASTEVGIEFRGPDSTGTWMTTTSPLGWVFPPLDVLLFDRWIVARGYERKAISWDETYYDMTLERK